MCVIAVKPQGITLDTQSFQSLENCFDWNPDGAGFMYPEDDGVRIIKGLMTYEEFIDAIAEHDLWMMDKAIVFHFRIATHGTVCGGNTHPFPITKDIKELQATDIHTKTGMVHNGIIFQMKTHKVLSDTMIFVRDYLYEFRTEIHSKKVQRLISLVDDSKFAFLSANKLSLVGGFLKTDGWYYSNDSYLNAAFGNDVCESCQQDVPLLDLHKFMNAWLCDSCLPDEMTRDDVKMRL